MNKLSKAEHFSWVMGFVGTGIGAGILFLPIQAGKNGLICFLVSCAIAFTLSYISHNVFAKLTIDSGAPQDFPRLVQSYLGNAFSLVATILFFLLSIGYLSIYVLGLNVGLSQYLYSLNITHQLLHTEAWFPLLIVFTLAIIITLNEKIIIKIMSLITFPLIVLLLILSIYLIPHWHLDYLFFTPGTQKFTAGIFFNIPMLIFASMFFPPITSMVLSFRKSFRNKEAVEYYSYKCIRNAQIVLLGFTIFFTFSSLMATPPEMFTQPGTANLNIMALLGKVYHEKGLTIVAPLVAVIAIITSFLGYYFGAKESAKNLIAFFLVKYKNIEEENMDTILNSKRMLISINLTFAFYLWFVALLNFNIEEFLNITCAPIIALLLYVTPVIIFKRIHKYRRFRGFVFYSLIFGAIILITSAYVGKLIISFH